MAVTHGRAGAAVVPTMLTQPIGKQAHRGRPPFSLAGGARQAASIGWTARDLFGLYRIAKKPAPNYRRLSRYDENRAGLAVTRPAGGGSIRCQRPPSNTPLAPSPSIANTISRRSAQLGDSLDDINPSGVAAMTQKR